MSKINNLPIGLGDLSVFQQVFPELTPRQTHIVASLSLGLSTKEIALLLSLQPQSVEAQVKKIKMRWGLEHTQNLRSIVLMRVMAQLLSNNLYGASLGGACDVSEECNQTSATGGFGIVSING